MKSPSAIIGDGDTMVLPDMPASVFEGEAEFAVVIGKHASQRQGRRRDELRLRLHQLHRRLGARRGAADQRVLPDEVARHVRADRAVHRHRRRDQGSAQAADHADQQRHGDAELQHRRHGAQDPALHRVGHLDPHAASRATSWRPAPTIAASTRSWTATRSSSTTEGLGTLHIKVKDEHKRTWARITRLKHKESGAQGVHTPQTGGKYMPARSKPSSTRQIESHARPSRRA